MPFRDAGPRRYRGTLLLGNLSGQPPAVAAAAATAINGIDRNLQLWSLLESVYYGLSLGSVLLLAAAGLAITFGVMGVINMAHGEMVMIGAYVTFVVQDALKRTAPAIYGASLPIAIPLAFIVAGVIGIAIERSADPLVVWKTAGNSARHLGTVAWCCSKRCAQSSAPTTETSTPPAG